MQYKIEELNALAAQFRRDLIETLYRVQTGHPGGSLSVVEILTAIYFIHANVKPDDPAWKERDRVVLCKGHAAPMLYRVLAEKGFFAKDECKNLRQCGSILPGHPSAKSTPGIDLASGPLGIGLSAAIGIALAQRMDGTGAYTYAILGDGELNEGTVWEALMSAAKFRVDNLIPIVDCNGVQLDGTCEEIMPAGNLKDKLTSFGANVLTVDGHDIEAISNAIDTAKNTKGALTVIIAKTVKGKGVSFMEGKNIWHGSPIGEEQYKQAMTELGGA